MRISDWSSDVCSSDLAAIVIYFVVQTVDGYLIVPMVAKQTVDLAPALVLAAQILFGALLGIMGLFLADPIFAMIKVALEREAERTAGAQGRAKTAARAEERRGGTECAGPWRSG